MTLDRAKQFMPFDALKGFREALEEKEKIEVIKKDLSEEIKEELSLKLKCLKIGDKIKVIYYKNKEYKQIKGSLKQVNRYQRYIVVENKKIQMDNIFKIIDT